MIYTLCKLRNLDQIYKICSNAKICQSGFYAVKSALCSVISRFGKGLFETCSEIWIFKVNSML